MAGASGPDKRKGRGVGVAEGMRRYWDERAAENAAFYVDTTMDYEKPDMEQFLATGRGIKEAALEAAPVQPARHELAVEIGPGLGRIALAMRDDFDRVIGIDVSREMVNRARELITDPAITFEVGDGETLKPVADDTADFVYSFTVLQHVPKVTVIEGYVAETARILRSGGVAALQWNNDPHPLLWKAKAVVLTALHAVGKNRGDKRNARQFFGSRVPLKRMLAAVERAGLVVEGTANEGTLFCWVWARKP